jgi:hypothetical protein
MQNEARSLATSRSPRHGFQEARMARPVHVETAGGLRHEVWIGPHRLTVDEPTASGGGDAGPTPVELLLAAVGT